MLDFIKNDIFIIAVFSINIILLIAFIANNLKLGKINREYNKFLKKLGKGENIEENLRKYVERVEKVEDSNKEIQSFCSTLQKEVSACIKKIGIIRYSAFKDTGSDLSFALALLDDNNTGVILNGIYSREMSNIYAKQIIKGKATNKLSEEEESALEIAVNK